MNWASFKEFLRSDEAGSAHRRHPTMDVCIQLAYVLENLASERGNSSSKTQEEKLVTLIRESCDFLPEDAPRPKRESFEVKAARFDSAMGTSFQKLLHAYCDEPNDSSSTVGMHRYDEIRKEMAIHIDALRCMVAAYYAAIVKPGRPVFEIRIHSTRLLDLRFWPKIFRELGIQSQNILAAHKQAKVIPSLSTIEPDRAIRLIADGAISDDVVLVYGREAEFVDLRELSRQMKIPYQHELSINIHRCIIGTRDQLGLEKDPRRLLESAERIAVQTHAEEFFKNIEDIRIPTDKLQKHRSTVAVHGYCQGGSGIGLSFLEFLDETDHKLLEVVPLDRPATEAVPEKEALVNKQSTEQESKDNPTPFRLSLWKRKNCVGITNQSHEMLETRTKLVDKLCELARKDLEARREQFALTESINKIIGTFNNSYTTVAELSSDMQTTAQKKTLNRSLSILHVDAWRGEFDLKVRCGLFIHGTGKIFGDPTCSNQDRHGPHEHPVFGHLQLAKGRDPGNPWRVAQMTMEISNDTNVEISVGSFLLELLVDSDGKCTQIRTPKFEMGEQNKECLIGEWIGKDLRYPVPNSGIFILHRDANLTKDDIQKIIDDYRKCVPSAPVYNKKIEHLYGRK